MLSCPSEGLKYSRNTCLSDDQIEGEKLVCANWLTSCESFGCLDDWRTEQPNDQDRSIMPENGISWIGLVLLCKKTLCFWSSSALLSIISQYCSIRLHFRNFSLASVPGNYHSHCSQHCGVTWTRDSSLPSLFLFKPGRHISLTRTVSSHSL